MYIRALGFVAASLLAPAVAFAQAPSCGSSLPVTMSLSSELSSTVPSASVGFSATMQNESSSVVHDAMFVVDVVQKDTGVVVDRFTTPPQIALFPQSAGKADFVWKTQPGLPSGTYAVEAALTTASTTRADVFAGVAQPSAATDIAVSDGIPQATISSVQVNGSAYREGSIASVAGASTGVTVVATNGTSAPYKGTFTWQLFAPSATFADHPLDTNVETVELHPGTSASVSYALTDTSLDGYYLEGELSDGKSSSYIDIFLARNNSVFPELNCGGATGSVSAPRDTALIIGIIAALLILGGAWAYHERRRVV